MLRKSAAFNALFPRLRGDVLAATLTHPDKWWYLSELARFLGTGPSSLQREVGVLVDGGILQQRRDGRRLYLKADRRSPLFRELRRLVEKTAGLVPALRLALEPFAAGTECAFVHGSLARGQEHALSDVDLLVVGRVGLAELAPALRQVERRLGREVNATVYSPLEFASRIAAGDHFLTEVLASPKEFVRGRQRELDAVAGKPRRAKALHVEAGTR